jgi:hypothetical protein
MARAITTNIVGRDREVLRTAEAAQVSHRDQVIDNSAARPEVVDAGRDRDQLLDRRRRGHGDRHHVVDEQCPRRDEAEQRCQLGTRHRVGAAAVRERPADLAVGHRDDREHDGDRGGHLDAEQERCGTAVDEDAQDLLRRVGRGRDPSS